MGEGQVVLVHRHKGTWHPASIQVLIFFRVQPVFWFPWLVYELNDGPCLLGSGCSSWGIVLGSFRLAVLRLGWAGRCGLRPVRALRRLCSLCMPAAMLSAIRYLTRIRPHTSRGLVNRVLGCIQLLCCAQGWQIALGPATRPDNPRAGVFVVNLMPTMGGQKGKSEEALLTSTAHLLPGLRPLV